MVGFFLIQTEGFLIKIDPPLKKAFQEKFNIKLKTLKTFLNNSIFKYGLVNDSCVVPWGSVFLDRKPEKDF